MAFALTNKQGAALVTKDSTYREDIEREWTFENYIKEHYDSWVDFARGHGHGENVKPILVTGVDLTREFATVAYSDNHTRMECEFSAGVPAVASASISVWGSWRTQGLVHTNCGPHPFSSRGNRIANDDPTVESAIPDEYNQCVFVRYYTIRRRFFIPTVLKAGGGPHQLPKGSPENDSESEEIPLVFPEDDSMEVDYPVAGPSTDVSDRVTHNVPLVGLEHYPHIHNYSRTGPRMTVTTLTSLQNSYFRSDLLPMRAHPSNTFQQRSNARSVLLHHHDIQNLLQVRACVYCDPLLTLVQGDEEPMGLLDESGVARRIEIDENGGKSRFLHTRFPVFTRHPRQ